MHANVVEKEDNIKMRLQERYEIMLENDGLKDFVVVKREMEKIYGMTKT